MLSLFQRRLSHSRVICLLANSQTADRVGAQLISELKATHGPSVKFIGAGGPLMQPDLSSPSLWSTDMFHPKPVVPFRSTVPEEYNWWLWLKRNPFTKNYSRPMHEVLHLVKKNNALDTIRRHRPAAIVTLDHDILSFKLHRGLMENYKSVGMQKPAQIHIGQFINKLRINQLPFLDHVMYRMPIPVRNYQGFVFPSTFIGHEAFARAYRFLLSRDPAGQALLKPDSVLMHKDHFFRDTEKFIHAERARFRGKFSIPEHATVLLLSPGNKESEFKWALPKLLETASQFAAANKPLNLTVVVPTTPQSLKFVSASLPQSSNTVRFLVTETLEDKNSALAGSNFAVCYNGEIVTECLVNQLPTIVVQNMRKIEFYSLLAWNRFTNDMNIVTDGAQFPEIIEGQCSPAKLNSILTQWYHSKAHAFWPLEGFEPHLYKILPLKEREMGMGDYNLYYTPSKLAAKVLWEFAVKSAPVAAPETENVFLKGVLGHQ